MIYQANPDVNQQKLDARLHGLSSFWLLIGLPVDCIDVWEVPGS